MHSTFQKLKQNWKDRPTFADYQKAVVKAIPPLGDTSLAGAEFFAKAPEHFFKKFEFVFEKHVVGALEIRCYVALHRWR